MVIAIFDSMTRDNFKKHGCSSGVPSKNLLNNKKSPEVEPFQFEFCLYKFHFYVL